MVRVCLSTSFFVICLSGWWKAYTWLAAVLTDVAYLLLDFVYVCSQKFNWILEVILSQLIGVFCPHYTSWDTPLRSLPTRRVMSETAMPPVQLNEFDLICLNSLFWRPFPLTAELVQSLPVYRHDPCMQDTPVPSAWSKLAHACICVVQYFALNKLNNCV